MHLKLYLVYLLLSSDKSDDWQSIIKREETDENGSESIGLKTTNLRLGNSGLTLLQFKHKRSDTHFYWTSTCKGDIYYTEYYNIYKIKSAPVRYSRN